MDSIAIYDFCQTLVDFETADQFVHFIRMKKTTRRINNIEQIRKILLKTKVLAILGKIMHGLDKSYFLNKHILLYELKGMTRSEIEGWAEQYYREIIKKHFIKQTIELLKAQKKEGYIIVIISASYEPFLRLFKEEYNVDYLLTNEFVYDEDDRFIGKLKEKDCVGRNKVKRLKKQFPDFAKEKFENCEAYGDSVSDIPILKIAKKGYVITHNVKKQWTKENGLEELVW